MWTNDMIWSPLRELDDFSQDTVDMISYDGRLEADMNNYYPPTTNSRSGGFAEYFLWQHEWNKHGKDYATILYKLFPERYSGSWDQKSLELQKAFYEDSLRVYKHFPGLQKLTDSTFTRESLAQRLGVSVDSMQLICTNKASHWDRVGLGNVYLRELRLCG